MALAGNYNKPLPICPGRARPEAHELPASKKAMRIAKQVTLGTIIAGLLVICLFGWHSRHEIKAWLFPVVPSEALQDFRILGMGGSFGVRSESLSAWLARSGIRGKLLALRDSRTLDEVLDARRFPQDVVRTAKEGTRDDPDLIKDLVYQMLNDDFDKSLRIWHTREQKDRLIEDFRQRLARQGW